MKLIAAYAVGVVGLFIILHLLFRRYYFQKPPGVWKGGIPMSVVSVVSAIVFVTPIGLGILSEVHEWFFISFMTMPVLLVSDWLDHRRYRQRLTHIRQQNALLHPGIFDREPPTDLHAVIDSKVAIFDKVTWRLIGHIPTQDMQLIQQTLSMEMEQEFNDIHLFEEVLTLIPQEKVEPGTLDLLWQACQESHDVVIRWVPMSDVPTTPSPASHPLPP